MELEKNFPVSECTAAMARGDEMAFRLFYDAYSGQLLRYLLVLARGDEQFARDVLQTTMIRVARYVKRFDEDEVFWRWLTRVAKTVAIDAFRQQKRTRVLFDSDGVEKETNESEWLGRVDMALEELDQQDRRLIEEFYFEKKPQKQIAEEKKMTVRAIESRLARLRQELKQIILKGFKNEI